MELHGGSIEVSMEPPWPMKRDLNGASMEFRRGSRRLHIFFAFSCVRLRNPAQQQKLLRDDLNPNLTFPSSGKFRKSLDGSGFVSS